jgi:hypothetical protein
VTRWPKFVLTVEVRPPKARPDMPPPAPPLIRLRQFLKLAWRAFGVVCIRIEPADEGPAEGEG